MKSRFSAPADPLEAFFEFPREPRLAELTSSRLFERYKENWRQPKSVLSVALSSDNPEVLDFGGPRKLHDGLVSNTFGFHPNFGTGHVLRTNGTIAMFWNGEGVAIVELANITKLPVLLDGERGPSRKKRIITEAMNQD